MNEMVNDEQAHPNASASAANDAKCPGSHLPESDRPVFINVPPTASISLEKALNLNRTRQLYHLINRDE